MPKRMVKKTGEYIFDLKSEISVIARYPIRQQIAMIKILPTVMKILVVPWLIANCVVLLKTK